MTEEVRAGNQPAGETEARVSPGPSYAVSFVCTGNICRSPMAEVITRTLLDEAGLADKVAVDSFGTTAWHAGKPAFPPALAALQRGGYDHPSLAEHVAREMDESIGNRHLVLTMDTNQMWEVRRRIGPHAQAEVGLLLDFDPVASRKLTSGERHVPDPYGAPDSAFDDTLRLIEGACRNLVAELPELLAKAAAGEDSDTADESVA